MAKKVLLFLFSFTLFVSFFANNPTPAKAFDGCSVIDKFSTTRTNADGTPAPADDTDKFIQLKIDTANQLHENGVYVQLSPVGRDRFSRRIGDSNGVPIRFTPSADGVVIIPILTSAADGGNSTERDPFKSNETYTLKVTAPVDDNDATVYCTATFQVAATNTDPGSDNYCEVKYVKDPPNNYTLPHTHVGIQVSFAKDANNTNSWDTHRVIIKSNYGEKKWSVTTSDLVSGNWFIPIELTAATYHLTVREFAKDSVVAFTDEDGKSCSPPVEFKIGTEMDRGHECGANTTGCDYTNIAEQDPLSQPCDSHNTNDYSDAKGCLKIRTALGTIDTGAPEFVRWILGFVLGISGGIVLIIIIITGYKLMTSSGDPEKVKNAREALTAAIVGLLFIIFALVILQLITADILQLPGFGS